MGILSMLSGQTVTYKEHIAPILKKNCVSCHNKTAIGAMPLTTYEEVSAYGQMIAYITQTGLMPPFLAEKSDHPIRGEKRLEIREIALIQQWLEQGLPAGGVSTQQQAEDINHLSNPDAVYSMAMPFEQYGIYYDQYRVFSIPTDLKEDEYVKAIEFVPGNHKIVRQVTISIDTSSRVTFWDEWDPKYGYFSFGTVGFVPLESRWYSWNPTQGATFHQKRQARLLPKGAKLIVHIHYGPTGVAVTDSSSIRMKFADAPTSNLIRTAPLIGRHTMTNDTFFIPPNEKVRFHAKFTVPFDLEVSSIFPHGHYLCRKWEIFAIDAQNGKASSLLKIDDWDFHWKQQFDFVSPVLLSKGTVVHAIAEYDNTTANLSNPSEPPREMKWGKRMYDELFLIFFSYSPYRINHTADIFFSLSPIVPNCSRPLLAVNFQTSKKAPFSIYLKKMNGEQLIELCKERFFSKGTHELTLNMEEFSEGNYIISIESKGLTEESLFVYMKKDFFD